MLKNSPVVPTFTNLKRDKCFGVIKTSQKVESVFGDMENWPEAVKLARQQEKDLAMLALGMAISFLEDALIMEKTLKPGIFKQYTPEAQD